MELPEGWVVLRVSDNGRGVDPAIVDRLFEPTPQPPAPPPPNPQHTHQAGNTGKRAFSLPPAQHPRPPPPTRKPRNHPHPRPPQPNPPQTRGVKEGGTWGWGGVGGWGWGRAVGRRPLPSLRRCSLSMNVVRLKLSSRAA